jgi:predicted ATPase
MQTAVDRHLALLDAAIASHHGIHFKTVGDAVQAAFPTAPDAVSAALDAQRTLLSEPWPEGVETMRVRMAVHTAAATPQDRDYLAPGLNRLARLLAAGHGGQVLLSSATQNLASDALPTGAGLRDLGEHPLRDLYRPERVFQLLHPDLPADFPSIRTLATRPNNLPLQPTPFLGREEQVEQIVDLLRREGVRLLTVTGPGGVGKTRVALQAAADVLEDFPDGVWFVDLSVLDDPALVSSVIAGVLGVRGEGRELTEQLGGVLGGKQLLLVLDNFERVVEATQMISDLLARVPGLNVLATSRTPLHAYGEREYPLAPLPLPDLTRLPPLEQMNQYEAVRLFIERAQAVKPDFVVTNANAPAVAEICHRLDGLPLAIELAAALVKMLPPQALLKRLEKRLPLLGGGARTLPARQQTMRNAVAWGHDLLTPEEQVLFRRLAVFPGGCTIEAAEAVASGDGILDVFGGMASLVDKSLLRQEEGSEGEPRFRMLETVREYGVERLEASGEEDAVRHRHAAYYAALGLTGDAERLLLLAVSATLDRFEVEIDNLRAAMTWAERARDAETGLGAALTFGILVFFRGQLAEGREWLTRLLALDAVVPIAMRARAVSMVGWTALFQGDLDSAEEAAGQAVELAATDPATLSIALNLLGCVFWDRGLLAEARQRFEDALVIARSLPNADDLTPLILGNFGLLAQQQGHYREAREAHEAGLAALRNVGLTYSHAVITGNLAHLAWEEGDHPRSASLTLESLNFGQTVRNSYNVATSLELAARHVLAAGRLREAARLLGAAEALRRRAGIPIDIQLAAAHQTLLAHVRDLLGETAWTQARVEGESLSLDQAISEAKDVMAEVMSHSTSVCDLTFT